MTHTPGPWHVGTREAHHCVYANHGRWVADASPLGKDAHTKHTAQLIAAAPDLLEALETIRAVVMGTSILKEQIIEATCDSAIRKAKGE